MPTMKSEVEVLLSQVSSNISEVFVKMSGVNTETKSRCLSAVSKILHELGCLVATKLSNNNVSSSSDHNSNFYKLYYDGEEESALATSSDEEESVSATSSDEEESVLIHSSDEEDIVLTNSSHEEDVVFTNPRKHEKDLFIVKMVSYIKSSAPSCTYDAKRMRTKRWRKKMKMIHPELRSLWKNVAGVLHPVNHASTNSNVGFPTVDWNKVNKRFLSNIPTPVTQPLHGCAKEPEFYEDVFERNDYGYHHNLGSKFSKPNPFGSVLGYLTDAGPIPVPDQVFHGYCYEESAGWILHASFPERKKKPGEKVKEKMRRRQRG